jgi:hypothetical protein
MPYHKRRTRRRHGGLGEHHRSEPDRRSHTNLRMPAQQLFAAFVGSMEART